MASRRHRAASARVVALALVVLSLASGLAAAEPDGLLPPGATVFPREADGRSVLLVGRSDGSAAVQVTAGPRDYRPQWSRDGRRIVFERGVADDVTSVWIVGADGAGERELDADPYAEHPRWSPDGRWIAYQVQTSETIPDGARANTTYELRLVRPNGSERRVLVRGAEGELGDENPLFPVESGAWAWSPDSRRIAYVQPRGSADPERGGVHVVEVDTGRTGYLGRGVDVAWAPDGRRLAVTTNDQGIVGEAGCGTVWIVRLAGGERRRLARPASDPCDRFPRWSPDGRTVVFVRSGTRDVFLAASPDGGRPQRLTPLGLGAHRWPADCSRLFEYVNPLSSGWVVRDARGTLRFVPSPVRRGDWRCTTRA